MQDAAHHKQGEREANLAESHMRIKLQSSSANPEPYIIFLNPR
jgi:hypothetical protein